MGQRDAEEIRGTSVEVEKKVEEPSLYKVLLHNDDYTTMEFVVGILQSIFHKEMTEAVQIMLQVHQNGFGVAGIYPYEIAETKVTTVEGLARQKEYPLRCSIEEI